MSSFVGRLARPSHTPTQPLTHARLSARVPPPRQADVVRVDRNLKLTATERYADGTVRLC
jgi:hypothetical protein